MSIQLKDVSHDGPSIEMPKTSAPLVTREEINHMIGQAMTHALGSSQSLAEKMLSDMRAEILAIKRPKSQVLAVEVNGQTRKLTKTANPQLGRMIVNAKLGLNTLLVGPAGSGKTIAAEQLSESLALSFGHVCLTAGASETWLFGRQTPKGFVEGAFSEKYRNGGVFLADEMDAADANLLLAINTALANGHLYNPIIGENIVRHKDFVFVGAANTIGRGGSAIYTGRNRLDAATLNRFVVLSIDYCPAIEMQVCPDDTLRELLQAARRKLTDLKSHEIISTRTLDQASKQYAAGIPLAEVFASLTMGWPDGIAKQCGVDPSAYNKPKKPAEMPALPASPKLKVDDIIVDGKPVPADEMPF